MFRECVKLNKRLTYLVLEGQFSVWKVGVVWSGIKVQYPISGVSLVVLSFREGLVLVTCRTLVKVIVAEW